MLVEVPGVFPDVVPREFRIVAAHRRPNQDGRSLLRKGEDVLEFDARGIDRPQRRSLRLEIGVGGGYHTWRERAARKVGRPHIRSRIRPGFVDDQVSPYQLLWRDIEPAATQRERQRHRLAAGRQARRILEEFLRIAHGTSRHELFRQLVALNGGCFCQIGARRILFQGARRGRLRIFLEQEKSRRLQIVEDPITHAIRRTGRPSGCDERNREQDGGAEREKGRVLLRATAAVVRFHHDPFLQSSGACRAILSSGRSASCKHVGRLHPVHRMTPSRTRQRPHPFPSTWYRKGADASSGIRPLRQRFNPAEPVRYDRTFSSSWSSSDS